MKTHNLVIREPIWHSRSIGISEYNVRDNLRITISYVNKHREKVFPYTYTMSKERILSYPFQYIKGIKIYIIPISDLTVVTEEEENGCTN